MRIRPALFFFLFIGMALVSCTSAKKMTYFGSSKQDSVVAVAPQPGKHVIASGDILELSVIAINAEFNALFNSSDNKTPKTYSVNAQGEIEIPLAGKVKVGNLMLEQAKDTIVSSLSKYLNGVQINLKLAGFRVVVLGEVNQAGPVILTEENATLLDALAQARDMNHYGKRKFVKVVRMQNGKAMSYQINMNSMEVFGSPVYYLQSNDIIYVEPTRDRAFQNFVPVAQVSILVVNTAAIVLGLLLTR